MQTIILGAGQVGTTLAQICLKENHDVTVVDISHSRLMHLQAHYDIRTVCGNASHPNVLRDAGLNSADMLIAVTNKDEINMIACQVAYTLFRTPKKIARIRSDHYLQTPSLFQNDALPIDILISPEREMSDYIARLIKYPRAKQVLAIEDNRLIFMGFTVTPEDFICGKSLLDFSEYAQGLFRPLGLVTGKQKIRPLAENEPVPAGADFIFITTADFVSSLLSKLHGKVTQPKKVFIAGAGHIGTNLLDAIKDQYQMKIIDNDLRAVKNIARLHDGVVALHGDASDIDILTEENINQMDIFCSLTNSEEVNMMSALVAKTLGAKTVMSLINRKAYLDLESASGIDRLIRPAPVTAGCLLKHIRRGDVLDAKSTYFGAEILSVALHGDKSSSHLVGRQVNSVTWPKGVTVASIVRRAQILFDVKDEVFKTEDHVVLFVADVSAIPKLQSLYQVDVGYV